MSISTRTEFHKARALPHLFELQPERLQQLWRPEKSSKTLAIVVVVIVIAVIATLRRRLLIKILGIDIRHGVILNVLKALPT